MCLHSCVKLSPPFPLRILPEGFKKIRMFSSCVGDKKKKKSFVFFFLFFCPLLKASFIFPCLARPLARPDWLSRLSVSPCGAGLEPLRPPRSGRGRTAALGGEGRSSSRRRPLQAPGAGHGCSPNLCLTRRPSRFRTNMA